VQSAPPTKISRSGVSGQLFVHLTGATCAIARELCDWSALQRSNISHPK